MKLPARFWRRVDKAGPDGLHSQTGKSLGPCWVWTGPLNPEKYGSWSAPVDASGRRRCTTLVYLAAYESIIGPVPDGLVLDHLCRVRRCCNPAHLEPVTPAVNSQRGETGHARGRQMAALTHCRNGHPFVGANLVIRTSRGRTQRVCRRCDVIKAQRYQAKKTKARAA